MKTQDDVKGWSSTVWGMAEIEVLQTLQPDSKKLIPPAEFGDNPTRLSTVGIPEKIIGGRSCCIYFFFDETTGLKEVLIKTNEINTKGYFETFLAMLTQKYGPAPIHEKDALGVEKVNWVFPSTVVELSELDFSGIGVPSSLVSIHYRPNMCRDLSAL